MNEKLLIHNKHTYGDTLWFTCTHVLRKGHSALIYWVTKAGTSNSLAENELRNEFPKAKIKSFIK
ncbi:MAG: hypothetical protein GWP10_13555 [Nitrospiraceae bacterium]|nr:hypothetical protein [Nitrospiraceae bacterium]